MAISASANSSINESRLSFTSTGAATWGVRLCGEQAEGNEQSLAEIAITASFAKGLFQINNIQLFWDHVGFKNLFSNFWPLDF
ncbi:hypothetical protein H6F75_16150 [Nodosilinea sp. FACHB-131]|uniref:hypothetical protein n=1 Tax=Nodosilinea sp. FACHB-131 TaxID=2692832 RepID=UPI00168A39C0|nr:hypothetical protein [Nodosilinea sp. FACHB-131]MBD1875019.1 hypothetical protein [Nodosilinea sp. FACHB-131]